MRDGEIVTAVVADDDDDVRALIATTLRRAGIEVTTCQNGIEAWEAIRRLRPQVAVLDLTMPGLSGVEVIQQVRSDPSLTSCRTLLLTGHRSEDVRGAADDADAYLAKPFSPRELTARVAALAQPL